MKLRASSFPIRNSNPAEDKEKSVVLDWSLYDALDGTRPPDYTACKPLLPGVLDWSMLPDLRVVWCKTRAAESMESVNWLQECIHQELVMPLQLAQEPVTQVSMFGSQHFLRTTSSAGGDLAALILAPLLTKWVVDGEPQFVTDYRYLLMTYTCPPPLVAAVTSLRSS